MAERSTFHHGNLRQALVTEAMAEIERSGVEGLSLRAIAEAIGVARSAPYRHFSSKQELVDAVIALASEELALAYSAIPAGLPPKTRLTKACEAYIAQISAHPRLVQHLSMQSTSRKEGQAGLPPPPSAWSLFKGMVDDCMPGASEKDADAAAVACWSALHGFAVIRNEGLLQQLPKGELALDAVLRRILMVVWGR